MSEILWQGIWISIVGLTILFGAMVLLVAVMMLLERLLRSQVQPQVHAEVEEDNKQAEGEEVVAAIAVALAHLRTQALSRDNLGSTLEAGPGQWWLAGRANREAAPPRPTSRWRTDI